MLCVRRRISPFGTLRPAYISAPGIHTYYTPIDNGRALRAGLGKTTGGADTCIHRLCLLLPHTLPVTQDCGIQGRGCRQCVAHFLPSPRSLRQTARKIQVHRQLHGSTRMRYSKILCAIRAGCEPKGIQIKAAHAKEFNGTAPWDIGSLIGIYYPTSLSGGKQPVYCMTIYRQTVYNYAFVFLYWTPYDHDPTHGQWNFDLDIDSTNGILAYIPRSNVTVECGTVTNVSVFNGRLLLDHLKFCWGVGQVWSFPLDGEPSTELAHVTVLG